MLVCETSLSATIDAVNAQLQEETTLDTDAAQSVVRFLLDRQIRVGSRRGSFASFPEEFDTGVFLFTGERLRTRWGTRNVLTLESARILGLLAGEQSEVRDALSRTAMTAGHACFAASHCVIGECAHSSLAYMRDAASDRYGGRRKWIERHVRVIGAHRDGTGRWGRFPFYYTLLVLLEVGTPSANAELAYARPACRRVSGKAVTGAFAVRRKRIVQRILGANARP